MKIDVTLPAGLIKVFSLYLLKRHIEERGERKKVYQNEGGNAAAEGRPEEPVQHSWHLLRGVVLLQPAFEGLFVPRHLAPVQPAVVDILRLTRALN